MTGKIRVAILDDHLSMIDGYVLRLGNNPNIEIVTTAATGEEMEKVVDSYQLDVIILDVSVPTSSTNPNPYPILYAIPNYLQKQPEMAILAISMIMKRSLIKSIMEVGASGYILKNDRDSILKLGDIISSVRNGGIYFSTQTYAAIASESTNELTPRQLEALSLYTSDPNITTEKIASLLNIAPSTARNLLSNAYLRLEVKNRTAAIEKARKLGLITPHTDESAS